jgi:hypothetical protein
MVQLKTAKKGWGMMEDIRQIMFALGVLFNLLASIMFGIVFFTSIQFK